MGNNSINNIVRFLTQKKNGKTSVLDKMIHKESLKESVFNKMKSVSNKNIEEDINDSLAPKEDILRTVIEKHGEWNESHDFFAYYCNNNGQEKAPVYSNGVGDYILEYIMMNQDSHGRQYIVGPGYNKTDIICIFWLKDGSEKISMEEIDYEHESDWFDSFSKLDSNLQHQVYKYVTDNLETEETNCRVATQNDLSDIIKLVFKRISWMRKRNLITFETKGFKNQYREDINNHNLFVFEKDSELLGICRLDHIEEDCCYLTDIITVPNHSNLNIVDSLCSFVSSTHNNKKIKIDVTPVNPKLRDYYINLGFQLTDKGNDIEYFVKDYSLSESVFKKVKNTKKEDIEQNVDDLISNYRLSKENFIKKINDVMTKFYDDEDVRKYNLGPDIALSYDNVFQDRGYIYGEEIWNELIKLYGKEPDENMPFVDCEIYWNDEKENIAEPNDTGVMISHGLIYEYPYEEKPADFVFESVFNKVKRAKSSDIEKIADDLVFQPTELDIYNLFKQNYGKHKRIWEYSHSELGEDCKDEDDWYKWYNSLGDYPFSKHFFKKLELYWDEEIIEGFDISARPLGDKTDIEFEVDGDFWAYKKELSENHQKKLLKLIYDFLKNQLSVNESVFNKVKRTKSSDIEKTVDEELNIKTYEDFKFYLENFLNKNKIEYSKEGFIESEDFVEKFNNKFFYTTEHFSSKHDNEKTQITFVSKTSPLFPNFYPKICPSFVIQEYNSKIVFGFQVQLDTSTLTYVFCPVSNKFEICPSTKSLGINFSTFNEITSRLKHYFNTFNDFFENILVPKLDGWNYNDFKNGVRNRDLNLANNKIVRKTENYILKYLNFNNEIKESVFNKVKKIKPTDIESTVDDTVFNCDEEILDFLISHTESPTTKKSRVFLCFKDKEKGNISLKIKGKSYNTLFYIQPDCDEGSLRILRLQYGKNVEKGVIYLRNYTTKLTLPLSELNFKEKSKILDFLKNRQKSIFESVFNKVRNTKTSDIEKQVDEDIDTRDVQFFLREMSTRMNNGTIDTFKHSAMPGFLIHNNTENKPLFDIFYSDFEDPQGKTLTHIFFNMMREIYYIFDNDENLYLIEEWGYASEQIKENLIRLLRTNIHSLKPLSESVFNKVRQTKSSDVESQVDSEISPDLDFFLEKYKNEIKYTNIDDKPCMIVSKTKSNKPLFDKLDKLCPDWCGSGTMYIANFYVATDKSIQLWFWEKHKNWTERYTDCEINEWEFIPEEMKKLIIEILKEGSCMKVRMPLEESVFNKIKKTKSSDIESKADSLAIDYEEQLQNLIREKGFRRESDKGEVLRSGFLTSYIPDGKIGGEKIINMKNELNFIIRTDKFDFMLYNDGVGFNQTEEPTHILKEIFPYLILSSVNKKSGNDTLTFHFKGLSPVNHTNPQKALQDPTETYNTRGSYASSLKEMPQELKNLLLDYFTNKY